MPADPCQDLFYKLAWLLLRHPMPRAFDHGELNTLIICLQHRDRLGLIRVTCLAPQREDFYGRLALLLQPRIILLRILLEGSVYIEPSPHPSRLRIGLSVYSEIFARNGIGILTQTVVEVFQIHSLSPFNQRLRKIWYGMKGPVPRVKINLTFMIRCCTRNRSFPNAQRGHALRELDRICVRNHCADIVTYYMDWVIDSEDVRYQDMEVLGHCGFVVATDWFAAGSCAAIVWRDHRVSSVGDWCDHSAKLVIGLRKAVDQEHGASRFDVCRRWARDVMDPEAGFNASSNGFNVCLGGKIQKKTLQISMRTHILLRVATENRRWCQSWRFPQRQLPLLFASFSGLVFKWFFCVATGCSLTFLERVVDYSIYPTDTRTIRTLLECEEAERGD
jgi:hypothetical protein